jgi:peptidoglycan/LPS O-acetylase OafA/YrhL
VLLAWLSYTLIENPVRRSGLLIRSSGLALTVGLSFTVLGVAAGAVLVALG